MAQKQKTKCPACCDELRYISSVERGEMVYRLSLSHTIQGTMLEYEHDEFYQNNDEPFYVCGDCGEELPEKWQNEDAIIKILKEYD